jgi:AraC family transcriptional regulator, positive regulator of tynA and feaB
MASIYRVSTAAVPPAERLAFWRDVCASAYGPMIVEAESDGFEGVLTRFHAEELEITSVKSSPLMTRAPKSSAHIRADEKIFTVQVVHSGCCRIRHANFETFATAGDMFIADGSRSYELSFSAPVQGLVLGLPWNRFRGYAEKFEALAGSPIDVHNGPGAVLSTFIRSAWRQLVEREGEDWPQTASDVIWDLLASVVSGDAGREIGNGRGDELRRKARKLVDSRLSDPGFCSADIAATLRVSSRYLQVVFAEVGTTPSRFLLARRLEAAAARLRCLDKQCSITEVALESGFSDLSYFSRAFRRRFGVSARAYRLRLGSATRPGQ